MNCLPPAVNLKRSNARKMCWQKNSALHRIGLKMLQKRLQCMPASCKICALVSSRLQKRLQKRQYMPTSCTICALVSSRHGRWLREARRSESTDKNVKLGTSVELAHGSA